MKAFLFVFSLILIFGACKKASEPLPPPPPFEEPKDSTPQPPDTTFISVCLPMKMSGIPSMGLAAGTGFEIVQVDESGRATSVKVYYHKTFAGTDTALYVITYPDSATARVTGQIRSVTPDGFLEGMAETTEEYRFNADGYVKEKSYSLYHAIYDPTNSLGDTYYTDEAVYEYVYNDQNQLTTVLRDQYPLMVLQYDLRGNLIQFDATHLVYGDPAPAGSKTRYPTIGIDHLAEVLDWIPVNQSPDLRTEQLFIWGGDPETGGDYIVGKYEFSNHDFDDNGRLVKYTATAYGEQADVDVSWQCKEVIDEIIQP